MDIMRSIKRFHKFLIVRHENNTIERFSKHETVEEDYEILQVAFRILRFYFLWPAKGQSSHDFNFKIKAYMALFFFSITGLSNLLYVIHVVSTNANYLAADIFESVVVMGTTAGVYLIMLNFIPQIPLFDLLIRDISTFGEFGKPPSFDATNSRMYKLIILFFSYGYLGVGCYVFLSLLDKSQCDAESELLDLERTCGYMSWMWLPFLSLDSFPDNVLFWLVQVISCVTECSSTTLVIGMFLAIVEMYLTRISHLKEMLLELNQINDNKNKRMHLNKCIRYHIEIIRMADQINECLGQLVFIASGLITVVMSLILTLFLIQPKLYTLMHGFGWVILMFTLCYTGQRLLDESAEIPLGVYLFAWFDGDLSLQKDVIFMLMRGNRPLQLKAAGFFVVNLGTFAGIMKNAYSFIAIVQQSFEEH